ncbi:hypothetical protein [[Eubacterium] hominis]|uniref:hypothetical protein n=1 Tax=[Eubacterium] hominis TaxID=2764325 RepID=UPI003A4DDB3C
MKQRIGLILALAGVILLIEPKMDINVMADTAQQLLIHYWPIGLVLLGACLITPKKKKRKSAR